MNILIYLIKMSQDATKNSNNWNCITSKQLLILNRQQFIGDRIDLNWKWHRIINDECSYTTSYLWFQSVIQQNALWKCISFYHHSICQPKINVNCSNAERAKPFLFRLFKPKIQCLFTFVKWPSSLHSLICLFVGTFSAE